MKSFSIFAPAISYLIGATGEMAEWSNAAVLKTVDCYRSGGSNPSFSARQNLNLLLINLLRFIYCKICTITVRSSLGILF